MFHCPHCGGANQPAASFCISCGEPLDEESLAGLAARSAPEEATRNPPTTAQDEEQSIPGTLVRVLQGKRLEVVLGVGLVAAVVFFALWSYANQEAASTHYRAGQDAYARAEYRAAISEFSQANGYLESSSRIDDAKRQLDKLEVAYRQVLEAAKENSWWQVAHIIASSEGLEQNYSDIPALLSRARAVNGKIAYLVQQFDGKGLYVAEADGGDAVYIAGTTFSSIILAISPDKRWLLYTNNTPATIVLYDMQGNISYELGQTAVQDPPLGSLWARFLDKQTFLVGNREYVATFSVSGQLGTPLTPTRLETTDAYERREYKTLLVSTDIQGNTTLSAGEYDGANPQTVAVEQGLIDGALVSKDNRFVVYRVCMVVGSRGAMDCTLKLADLKTPGSKVQVIATIPTRRKNDPNNSIEGEFTEDGKHLLVIEQYDRMYEAHLVNLETYQWSKMPDSMLDTGTEGEVINPLMDDYSPGLRFWQGPNSLAHTDSAREANVNLRESSDFAAWYETRSHRISISPDEKYAVYVAPSLTDKTGLFNLHIVALTGEQSSAAVPRVIPFGHNIVSNGIFMYFLPDNVTMITSGTLQQPGITAYRLDTGEELGKIMGPNNGAPQQLLNGPVEKELTR